MRRLPSMLAWLLLLAATLLAQGPAEPAAPVRPTEHPFLWVIEGEVPSYLYGTIHIPDERVTTLPAVVDEALARADAVYTEIELDVVALARVAGGVMLEEGRTLRELLPDDLRTRLVAYLERKGYSLDGFDATKPWVLATQLPLLDHLEEIMSKTPLDLVLYERARREGKQVGGLETVDEQLGVFEGLTLEEQVAFLEVTLDDVLEAEAEGSSALEELVEVYLGGDEARLAEEMNAWVGEDEPVMLKLERALIVDRNARMAQRILEKLEANPGTSYVFAVGAAHFPGEYGILNLLATEGVDAQRIGVPEPANP